MHELGVDDTHPWLPRSPNPLTPPAEMPQATSPSGGGGGGGRSPSSSGQSPPRSGGSNKLNEDPNRNMFFENVQNDFKTNDSSNEKLECMDRKSFRRLMDDLDNITIQEPIHEHLREHDDSFTTVRT